jgi:hypothetical protein
MNKARIREFAVTQGNQGPQDVIALGNRLLKVTIKAHPASQNDVYVGINQTATPLNVLSAGQSVTYHDERVYLDGLDLYISFSTANPLGGGIALISIISESEEKVC